ncbi:Ger(x)C family spore germination protein [Anoxybacteroides tepidamans]|uniref:Ger(x)C family spore germination protein n=1 Tax=Anoxybacteroides tepidamans TaxID=265948 RepID=UPI000488A10C|nr:Ger(x)C family spore germination protein [Anoxybacillus tepidamans]
MSGLTKFKKMIICFLICSNCLLLSGCWDRVELNDLALVTGLGIDKKGKNTMLTVQLVVPKQLGGGMAMGGSNTKGGGATIIRTGTGAVMADAIRDLQEKIPRRLFWGHVKAVVFSEKVAKEGIRPYIDFLSRNPQMRLRSNMFICKGSAKNVLELSPPIEQSSAEVMRELSELQFLFRVTVKDALQMLAGSTQTAAIPLVQILPAQKGMSDLQTIAFIQRTAIFKKDRMIGSVNDKMSRGLLWIRNEVEQANITVSLKGAKGTITAAIIKMHTKLIPEYKNGKWKMIVKITSEDDVISNATNLSLYNKKHIHLAQKALADETANRIYAALHKVQKMKADVVGFGEAFHRKYPRQWNQVKDRWEDIFPNVEVTIKAKVNFRRPGMNTIPQGIPPEEVKK